MSRKIEEWKNTKLLIKEENKYIRDISSILYKINNKTGWVTLMSTYYMPSIVLIPLIFMIIL
jgi:hypothetical protein